MSDELNPSSTPEIGGNNQSAANKSNDEGKTNPKNEGTPRKRQTKKWFGLTKTQWRELAGILILIPWVWNDLLDTHNFSKLCLLAISLVVAQGLAASFLKPRWIAVGVGILSLIPVAATVWENSRPEPSPHFKFSLLVGGKPDSDMLELTNDFLLIPFSPKKTTAFNIKSVLCLPTEPEQSNIVLRLFIDNVDPTISADGIDVTISASKELNCVPDARWVGVVNESIMAAGQTFTGEFVPHPWQSWAYPQQTVDFSLLPGNSQELPPVQISQTVKIFQSAEISGFFEIVARSKNSQIQGIIFNIIFPKNTPFRILKPFVAEGTQIGNGQMNLTISQERLKETLI